MIFKATLTGDDTMEMVFNCHKIDVVVTVENGVADCVMVGSCEYGALDDNLYGIFVLDAHRYNYHTVRKIISEAENQYDQLRSELLTDQALISDELYSPYTRGI